MEIRAWKCEQTGKLFEEKAAYESHLAELAHENRRNHRLAELRANLPGLQNQPFDDAKSANDLLDRIIDQYAAVVSSLVELGKLKPAALERKLVAIENREGLRLGDVDRQYRDRSVLPDDETVAINGVLTFVFEGRNFNGLSLEPLVVFPLLACGVEPAYFKTDNSEVAMTDTQYRVTLDICILVQTMRYLQRAYDEHELISKYELKELVAREQAFIEQIYAKDIDIAACEAAIRDAEAKIARLQAEQDAERERKEKLHERVAKEALAAVPRLLYWTQLREFLCIR